MQNHNWRIETSQVKKKVVILFNLHVSQSSDFISSWFHIRLHYIMPTYSPAYLFKLLIFECISWSMSCMLFSSPMMCLFFIITRQVIEYQIKQLTKNYIINRTIKESRYHFILNQFYHKREIASSVNYNKIESWIKLHLCCVHVIESILI